MLRLLLNKIFQTLNKTRLSFRGDIKNLEEQLHQIRSAAVSGSNLNVLTLASLQLVHSFNLDTELSAYCLQLESPVSIDHVLVQCDCPIDLLDQDDGTAIRSDTQLNFEDRNAVLTTFRCQANTTHLTLYLRTVEGHFGVLRVYVAPRSDGPIACKQLEFPIRPLSLHRRTHTFLEDCERPLNRLTLSGRFSLAEMHQWVQVCLPETPDKPPIVTEETTGVQGTMETVDEEHVRLIYESTFIGSKLECCYKKQQATFRSDNISTIAIVKDVLTKEATKRKIVLSLDIGNLSSSTHASQWFISLHVNFKLHFVSL
ncbi:Bardet-Biedl syndrome 7 [Paragonimus westermani]|uniref:Bardet-Biedl syndrome 7 n=1 Tax=Paragonimus westermani TaxID=34504 RepID=A0A8T0DL70_9TREM|nr:Bardet-Biedl syndrome 7 [Paragonimus westermani]